MSSKAVKLFSENYTISEEKYNYLKVKNMFKELGVEAYHDYVKKFNETNHNLEAITRLAEEQIVEVYFSYAKKITKILSDYEIYDVSVDAVASEFYSHKNAFNAFEKIMTKYESIITDQAEMDAYRTARRQNRGRWEGGGFGVGGALKGAATAGALNMASGAAHGAVNLMGKAVSSISAALEKSSIFDKEVQERTIANGIFNDIRLSNMFYMNILSENKICDFEIISKSNAEKAKTIFENCKNNVNDVDKKKELYFQILTLDGLKKEYYAYGLKTFAEDAKAIIKIAELHFVDVSEYVEEMIRNISDELPQETEADTLKVKEIIVAKMNELGVESSNTLEQINEKLHQFDILQTDFIR